MPGHPYPKSARLLKQADFERVFARGRSVSGRYMIAWACAEDDMARRLGLKVTKKTFPLAMERNRAKRLLRESFRHIRPELSQTPWDLVVIARRKILDAKEPDVRKEMAWACGKLRVGCWG